MMPDDKTIVLIAGDHTNLRIVELAVAHTMRDIGPMLDLVCLDGGIVERAMMAADAHLKVIKEFREIERHPRYRDQTPRSPKQRFRKGR